MGSGGPAVRWGSGTATEATEATGEAGGGGGSWSGLELAFGIGAFGIDHRQILGSGRSSDF